MWVDSILLSSLTAGDWVVFENPNYCNPSILDRLNPLLEEGHNSLTLNEQGLLNNDTLREITAHNDFRAFFVLSHSSLHD